MLLCIPTRFDDYCTSISIWEWGGCQISPSPLGTTEPKKSTISIRLDFLVPNWNSPFKNSQFFWNFMFFTNIYPGCELRIIYLPLILNCCFIKSWNVKICYMVLWWENKTSLLFLGYWIWWFTNKIDFKIIKLGNRWHNILKLCKILVEVWFTLNKVILNIKYGRTLCTSWSTSC